MVAQEEERVAEGVQYGESMGEEAITVFRIYETARLRTTVFSILTKFLELVVRRSVIILGC